MISFEVPPIWLVTVPNLFPGTDSLPGVVESFEKNRDLPSGVVTVNVEMHNEKQRRR